MRSASAASVTCSQRGWSMPSWSSRALNLLPVLGHVDALGAGAEDAHAGAVQAERQVVGHLPAHAHDDAVGLLALVEVEHRLEAHLVEDQLVAHVVVGADRLGVVVEHHGLVPELARRLERVDAAPVELDARADAVGARAEHHDLLAPRGRDVGRAWRGSWSRGSWSPPGTRRPGCRSARGAARCPAACARRGCCPAVPE